jgi:hypothetical protein
MKLKTVKQIVYWR